MKEENKTAFFLTEMELALLLGAKEIPFFSGFPLAHGPDNRQDVLQTLLGLNKKGLLVTAGEGFRTDPGLSSCFEILQKAKGVLSLTPQSQEQPQLCCYPGEELLAMEPSPFRQETFKIWRMTWKDLEQWMRGCGRRIRGEYHSISHQRALWTVEIYISQDEAVLECQGNREAIPSEGLGQRIKTMIMEVEAIEI